MSATDTPFETVPFDVIDVLEDREGIADYMQLALADPDRTGLQLVLSDCWRAFCAHVDPAAAERHPELAALLTPSMDTDIALLVPLLRALGLTVALPKAA